MELILIIADSGVGGYSRNVLLSSGQHQPRHDKHRHHQEPGGAAGRDQHWTHQHHQHQHRLVAQTGIYFEFCVILLILSVN